MMRIPEDLRSRYESLSDAGKKAVDETLKKVEDTLKGQHTVEMKLHHEEEKDHKASIESAQSDDDHPEPIVED